MSRIGPRPGDGIAARMSNGYGDGFVVKYRDTTHIDITSGIYDVNGKLITLSADAINIEVTGIPSVFDIIYHYINYSASGPTSPVFYNAPDEPVFDPVRDGWYHPTNTNNRMCGVTKTPAGSSTLIMFATSGNGSLISVEYPIGILPAMATGFVPDNNWKTPINDGDVVTSVCSQKIRLKISNSRSGDIVRLWASTKEIADIYTNANAQFEDIGYHANSTVFEIDLGDSSQVRIAGNAGADNALALLCLGETYRR